MKKITYLLVTVSTLLCLQAQAQFISGGAGKTILQNNGDLVGIGTTNPAFVLDVQRAGNASMNFKSTTGTANLILDRANSASTSSVSYRTNGSPTWQTGTLGTDNFAIRNIALGNSSLSVTAATNYIGIGTNAPASRLHVNDNGLAELKITSTTNGTKLSLDRTANGYEAVTQYSQTGVPQWKTGLLVNNSGAAEYVIKNEISGTNAVTISTSNTVLVNSGTLNVGEANTSSIYRSGNDLAILPYAPISATPGNLFLCSSSGLFKSGNVGIGTTSPTLAKLTVNGAIGNTVSLFRRSTNSAGISIVADWPGLYFNSYYDGGTRVMTTGYAGLVNFNPTSGYLTFNVSPTSGANAGAIVTTPEAMFVHNDGSVSIGTAVNAYKLNVCGTVRATEVRVSTGWCDYVFADDYNLRPLSEVESFIKENKHLPDVTKGSIIESEGLEVGKTSAEMIRKIEELTLYIIQQQKRMDAMQTQIENLEAKK